MILHLANTLSIKAPQKSSVIYMSAERGRLHMTFSLSSQKYDTAVCVSKTKLMDTCLIPENAYVINS